MESHKLDRVREFFRRRHVDYITDIRIRESDGTVLVSIPNTAIGERAGKAKTSQRQLRYIHKKVQKELSVNIEFLVYRGQEQEQLEAGLRALIRKRFKEIVTDCFLSFPKPTSVEVWLDLKIPVSAVNSSVLQDIGRTTKEYLKLFNIRLAQIQLSGPQKEGPSMVVILRAVKALAPASITQIKKLLEDRGFDVPSSSWLRGRLDLLRKKEMLLRQKDDSYVLTEVGLRLVPHGAFRSSSDIERALALGRKKWY